VDAIVEACHDMSETKTGALIVLKRNNSLDFIKDTGDYMNAEVNRPILKSIFYKNSPLHDGAVIIEENKIVATRVILPLSKEANIPLRFGLRHRAGIGITDRTDALALVVSEETGEITYIKDSEFVLFKNLEELNSKIRKDLAM
jgi:DNA integrity scanning protein DisA with diadenylate cyclase activity